MKYLLLFLLVLSTTLISMVRVTPTELLRFATERITTQSKQVVDISTTIFTLENKEVEELVKHLINEQAFLTGDQTKISTFIKSDFSAQDAFIDSWGTAANAISKAAYQQSMIYDLIYGGGEYYYPGSTLLLQTPNAIYTFDYIADNLTNTEVKQSLQRHLNLKSEEDSIIIFKNIHYTLLYQWLTYKALEVAKDPEYSNDPLHLERVINFFTEVLPINTKYQELMTEFKREQQILTKLLEVKTLPKSKDQLTPYLQLVRDYMLDVVIPPMRLEPPIKLFSEKEAPLIKRKNLVELSKKPEFKELKERDPNNPLVINVEQDLAKLQPEPATPQALLGYLINLSTQLTQLHANMK